MDSFTALTCLEQHEEFILRVLGIPEKIDLSQFPEPVLVGNPLQQMEGAAKMSRQEIVVKMTTIMNEHNLAPGLKAISRALAGMSDTSISQETMETALYLNASIVAHEKPSYADQLVPIRHISLVTHNDPFEYCQKGAEAPSRESKELLATIEQEAATLFAVQQRAHLFTLLVMGRRFRLLLWNRSGLSVSQPIDYYENWRIFCNCLWRISLLARACPEQLGFDPSATRIYPNDARWALMTEAARERDTDADHATRELDPDELTSSEPVTFKYVRNLFSRSLQSRYWPRYELEVHSSDGRRKFLVGKPCVWDKSLVGRGTRGYVALDSLTGNFVWLKDVWRVDHAALNKEGEMLSELNKAQVTNVPTLLCHGDVYGQTTKTPRFGRVTNSHVSLPAPHSPATPTEDSYQTSLAVNHKRKRSGKVVAAQLEISPDRLHGGEGKGPVDCTLRHHIHYRIVVQEVCLTLSLFEDGLQLVSLIFNCASAHYQAVEHGILHRDISSGNVLILPYVATYEDGTRLLEWKGILTDWELSEDLTRPPLPGGHERIGTWQSMSVARSNHPTKAIEVADDLESIFYVLLYHSVRYLKSNCINVPIWLEVFFDASRVEDGARRCSHIKADAIERGRLGNAPFGMFPAALKFDSPMDGLLATLLEAFRAYYAVKQYDEQQTSKCASLQEVSTPAGPPAPAPRLARREPLPHPLSGIDDEQLRSMRTQILPHFAGRNLAPTAEERKWANCISDSRLFLLILHRAMKDEWMTGDRREEVEEGDVMTSSLECPSSTPSTDAPHKEDHSRSSKRQRRS